MHIECLRALFVPFTGLATEWEYVEGISREPKGTTAPGYHSYGQLVVLCNDSLHGIQQNN